MKELKDILETQLNEAKSRLDKLQMEWNYANDRPHLHSTLSQINEGISNQQNYIIKLNQQYLMLTTGFQPNMFSNPTNSTFFSSNSQATNNQTPSATQSQYYTSKSFS